MEEVDALIALLPLPAEAEAAKRAKDELMTLITQVQSRKDEMTLELSKQLGLAGAMP